MWANFLDECDPPPGTARHGSLACLSATQEPAVPAVRYRHSPSSSPIAEGQPMPSNDLLFDVLKRFANTLAHSYDVADVLYELTEHAVEVLTATSAGVSLVEGDSVLKFVTASSQAAADLELVQQESQQGPCHQAFATATAVMVNGITETSHWPVYRSKARRSGCWRSPASRSRPASVISAPSTSTGRSRETGRPRTFRPRACSPTWPRATSCTPRSWRRPNASTSSCNRRSPPASSLNRRRASSPASAACGSTTPFELLRKHARRNSASLSSVADAVVRLGLRP